MSNQLIGTLLERLEERIGTEARWTQHYTARDRSGAGVGHWDETAVSWCLLGGLFRVGCDARQNMDSEAVGDATHAATRLLARSAQEHTGNRYAGKGPCWIVGHVNDRRTTGHADVMAIIRRAREMAR